VAALGGSDLEFSQRLISELNRSRLALGLGALSADADLTAIAQGRVEAMVREGRFSLVSASGAKIEDELDAAHYSFRLVGQKLVRSAAEPFELASAWRREADQDRNSVFEPTFSRVGIGVAQDRDTRLVDIVLVAPMSKVVQPTQVRVEERSGQTAALLGLIAERRKARGRAPLIADPVLSQAAQQHAEALLAAVEKGRGPESVTTLSDRITDIERSRSAAGSGLYVAWNPFGVREIQSENGSRRGNVAGLSSLVVVDASSAAAALQTLAAAGNGGDLLDPSLRRIGIGFAAGAPEARGRIVWVVGLRRQ
jgi:uncharacterized protein YkwD